MHSCFCLLQFLKIFQEDVTQIVCHIISIGRRDPAAAEPGRARPGWAGPEGSDPSTARRQRRRQADAGQGPRRFLQRSRLRRSGSARPGCVTSGPGSTGGRRGRGVCWVVVPLCWRFVVSRRSIPGSDQGTAGAEGCDRQQRRGLGLLERSYSIASGFRLPALPARIFLTRVFLMDSSLHCL